jgi:uncharacterized damage-inducible protein DinB
MTSMSEPILIELLYGKGAHANPIACVEDVSLELAGKTVENFPNSIYQIVAHMNYWTAFELQRIRLQHPVYPAHAAESWPVNPAPANENEWKLAVERFSALLGELATLAEYSPEILAREAESVHPDHARHPSSQLAILWQTLVHNSYHVGQIALLRRALGAWPPRAGGDTW